MRDVQVRQETEVSGSELSAACLVPLGHVPSTLNRFGWLRPFGNSTLLTRCLEGLKGRSPWPVAALVTPPCNMKISSTLAQLQVKELQSRGGAWLRSIGFVSLNNGLNRVVLAHGLVGLDLLPESVIKKLITLHGELRSDVTFCGDLPAPLYLGICEERALEFFASLPEGVAANGDPRSVFANLASIAGTLEETNQLIVRRLELLHGFGLNRGCIPRCIPMKSEVDVERIQTALALSDAQGTGDALRTFRDLLIRDWAAESRQVIWPTATRTSGKRVVLFASNPSAFSGSEQALISTVQSLRGGDIDLHCLIGEEGVFTERLKKAGAKLHCPNRDFAAPTLPNFLLSRAVFDAVRPEILHCNAYVGTPLLAQARANGVPILQWARLARFDGILDHLIAADIITAVSGFVRERLKEEMIDPEKIRVLYDGIDTEYFSPGGPKMRLRMREKLQLRADEFTILCIARFVPYKRHDLLIHGFARASAQRPGLRLLLAGDGDGQSTMSEMQALVSRLGVEDAVSFTGFVSDVRTLITAADAVALCSDDEPLGCSVLEAMAMAKPIILSQSGGFPEIVTDNHDGLLFNAGDAEALAQRILKLAASAALCKRLGSTARKTVQERFSLFAHASALRRIYEEVLGRKRDAQRRQGA